MHTYRDWNAGQKAEKYCSKCMYACLPDAWIITTIWFCLQLTRDTVETTLSEISQSVKQSEGNVADQTELNLNRLFEALSNVSKFINYPTEPELIITKTVSNKTVVL